MACTIGRMTITAGAPATHDTPADPAEFTLDRTAEQRSEGQGVVFNVLVIVALAATAVTGVVALL